MPFLWHLWGHLQMASTTFHLLLFELLALHNKLEYCHVDVRINSDDNSTTSCISGVQASTNAVLEANAKVNGRAPFLDPHPSCTPNQFWCHLKYITTSTKGVHVQNLVGIDSAVMMLHMLEMSHVCVHFLTYASIHPFLFHSYRSQFWDDFNTMAQTTYFFATISAFWGSRWYFRPFKSSDFPKTQY